MLNKFKEDPFGHSLEILLALNLVPCVQAICLHPVVLVQYGSVQMAGLEKEPFTYKKSLGGLYLDCQSSLPSARATLKFFPLWCQRPER